MKKYSLIAILLGMLVLSFMVSCTKPDDDEPNNSENTENPINPDGPFNPITPEEQWGVYNPGKKIKKVYKSSTYQEKYLSEVWNWNDNQLKSIDYYSANGYFGWTEDFTYKENRLDRIDVYVEKEYATFTYDGNLLKSINYYFDNSLSSTIEFTYQDGKAKKMIQTEYYYKSQEHLDLLNLLFAPEICERVEKCLGNLNSLGNSKNTTTTCEFIWDGNNISKITILANYGEGGMVSATCIFQCDQKNNPFKGYFDLLSCGDDATDMLIEGHSFFKNNVTKAIIDSSEGGKSNLNYTYQYDSDDYPSMQIMSFEGDDYKYFTYFEYE